MFKGMKRRPLPEEPDEVMNNEPATLEAGESNFSRSEFRLTPFHTWYHSVSTGRKKFRRPLFNCPSSANVGVRF